MSLEWTRDSDGVGRWQTEEGGLPSGVTSPGDGGLVFAPESRDVTPIDIVLPAGDRDWATPVFRIIDEDGNVVARISADTATVFAVGATNGSFVVTSGTSVDSGDLLFDLNPFAGVCEMNAPHGGTAMLQVTHPGDSKTPVVQVSTLGHADVVATLGFYGTAPVVQPVVPLTGPAVQDVIDSLVALGLVTQSD